MFYCENLLRNEFFPAELPSCFNTNDLADNAAIVLPAALAFSHKYSIPVKYSGYKTESSRRKFSIPNPFHYIRAVNVVVENKDDISAIMKKSKYSLTAPMDKDPEGDQPYAKKTITIADTKRAVEMQYQNNRYEIRLDISSFFDSIYTHSIPWAIHGVAQAKQKRNDKSLLGNILDENLRAMNYDQTNGILVGNAVSRIVSEILLCTIDEQIQKRFPQISCCRFVDDYYIYTQRSTQIQEIISFIRTSLAQYELSFNENKIQINESPFLYGKPWVEEVKQYIHLQPDIFLTKLIMEFNKHKDLSIIKYGLKVISFCKYDANDWTIMQSRILNLWVRFPSLADRILPMLWQNKDNLKKGPLKVAIYTVIDEAIVLRRDQELVWALWFVKIFNIKISQSYIVKVLSSENDIAKIIVLDIISQRKLKKHNIIKREINRLRSSLVALDIDDDGKNDALMWSQHWLLAYEADLNKWLTLDGTPFNVARKNQFFKVLIENKIKFYDPNFVYGEPYKKTRNHEYATRTELYTAIDKLRSMVLLRAENHNDGNLSDLVDKEEQLYEKIVELWENEEMVYTG